MTQFIPVTHIGPNQIPAMEYDSGCDNAYLIIQNDSEQLVYLSYSVKRDFLSVPLTYNIVKFSCASSCLEIHQMPIDEYLDGFEEEVSIPQPGFYQFEAHDDGSEDQDDETDIIVIVDREKVMELTFEKMERFSDIYHSADAKTALISALSAS